MVPNHALYQTELRPAICLASFITLVYYISSFENSQAYFLKKFNKLQKMQNNRKLATMIVYYWCKKRNITGFLLLKSKIACSKIAGVIQ